MSMNIKSALKEAQRRWGKNGAVRKRPDAPNKNERAAMSIKAKEIRAQMDALDKKSPQWDGLRKELRNYILPSCPCTVGCVEMAMFFAVRGEGDTWEEAFEDALWKEACEHDGYYHQKGMKPCIHCKAAKAKAGASCK